MRALVHIPITLEATITPDARMPSSRWHTAARVLLVSTLLAAPLAFGAVQPWAWGTMITLVMVALALWAAGCVSMGRIKLIWSWMYIPAAAVLAFAAVQYAAGWTFDKLGTREAILKGLAYVAVFFLTQHLFGDASPQLTAHSSQPESGRRPFPQLQITNHKLQIPEVSPFTKYFIVVAVYTFALAVFAIIQFFAAPGLLYGAIRPRWGGYVFGPYVNHNHYAGLMEMLIPLSMGCVLSLRRRHPAKVPLTFGILVALVSVFLSGSRGGSLAILVEAVLFVAVLLLAGRRGVGFRSPDHPITRSPDLRSSRVVLVMALVIAILGGACFLWLDPGEIWQRWEELSHSPDLTVQDRNTMARDTLHMFRAHAWKGVGLGAFETAYTGYQTWVTDAAVDLAHNDYAQFVAELGILGWMLALATVVGLLWLGFRRAWARGFQPGTENWELLALLGVCGLLVHSYGDFNLHIPANAAWFACAAALATAPLPEMQS